MSLFHGQTTNIHVSENEVVFFCRKLCSPSANKPIIIRI